MTIPVIAPFSLAENTGWGVYARNLAVHWPRYDDRPLCHVFIPPGWKPGLTDDRYAVWSTVFRAHPERVADAIVLHGLGSGFDWRDPPLWGRRTIAIVFAETRLLSDAALERARHYDLIVAGSSWTRDVLAGYGLPVALVLQGVDTALFRPGPKTGRFGGRFVVFSGGKPELRKGQDLVLAAFARFAQSRLDALLATAWHSSHMDGARELAHSPYAAPVPMDSEGRADIAGWVAANGVAPDQFVDLGPLTQAESAELLREVDVALFPNRCESGTNLVAMECAASSVPLFASANTGHLDLIWLGAAIPLAAQRVIVNVDGADWGWRGSSVDEMVAKLAWAYDHRSALPTLGAQAAAAIAPLSWPAQIARLAEAVVEA